MRVCHVITGLGDGGAEVVLYRLCTHPQPQVQHVVIALGPEDKYAPMLRAAGVETHCLGWSRRGVPVGAALSLVRLLAAQRPDVVQTWMYHANLVGGLAARLARSPRVIWGLHHTHLTPATSRTRTRVVNRLCAWLSSTVPSGIVACADTVRTIHEQDGYSRHKFVVVTNGCNTWDFRPDDEAGLAVRRALAIDAHALVVGFVGRWHADKDHANLLAAFARVVRHYPEARLLLVGKACRPDNAALAAQIEQSGVGGAVLPLGPRTDVAAVMNALDLHVLPSSSEAFPNVVAEAMACGTPCVVTDVGDAAVIAGPVGWVVPPRDPARLAAAMDDALARRSDAAAWRTRQDAVRQRIVSEFSLERMVQRYHAAWGQA